MILILSGPGDAHADAVEAQLAARGAAWLRFDTADHPDRSALSFTLEHGGHVRGSLVVGSTSLALEDVSAIWVRRPGRPQSTAAGVPAAGRAQVAADAVAVLDDLWNLLPAFCLPGTPDVIAAAAHKSEQLARAARHGFEIPFTWTGNDPDALLDTVAARPHGFVTKRTAPSQRLTDAAGAEISRLTTVLRPADLVHVGGVAHCPLTVQEALPKAFELRVTVVGDRVFTAVIHSQLSHHTRHDWRRFDLVHTPIETYELEPEVAARCAGLVAGYGLSYGAIDLVMTPDGRLVFLELNPSGQYLWVEQLTGQPISAALAGMLLDPLTTHRPETLRGPDVPART